MCMFFLCTLLTGPRQYGPISKLEAVVTGGDMPDLLSYLREVVLQRGCNQMLNITEYNLT